MCCDLGRTPGSLVDAMKSWEQVNVNEKAPKTHQITPILIPTATVQPMKEKKSNMKVIRRIFQFGPITHRFPHNRERFPMKCPISAILIERTDSQ